MGKYFKVGLVTAVLLSSTAQSWAENVTINYAMWDGIQAPVYRKCADAFEAANAGIKINIIQDGWSNYWTTLTTSFISGGAPDVFVNHSSRFGDFVENGQLIDLTPMIQADKVDMTAYRPGLAEIWSKDGHQWGLPKDWDTIALAYDKKAVADAGLTEEELKNLTWNPKDGGTFEKVVAKLTVDVNGKRGDDPTFDKSNVKTYGFVAIGDGYGQENWSSFAATAGFKYIDQRFGKHYQYDNPALAETLTYFRDLALVKGFAVSLKQAGGLNTAGLFVSGKVAMAPQGSWAIAFLNDSARSPYGVAAMPIGPEGRRSMMNGLADSISATSAHPQEAWKWVKYLGSASCQDIVGQSGIVFPAIPSGTEAAIKAHQAKGLDVTAFTDIAKPETTFSYPLSARSQEIYTIFKTAVEQILLNQGDPAKILGAANEEANALLQ